MTIDKTLIKRPSSSLLFSVSFIWPYHAPLTQVAHKESTQGTAEDFPYPHTVQPMKGDTNTTRKVREWSGFLENRQIGYIGKGRNIASLRVAYLVGIWGLRFPMIPIEARFLLETLPNSCYDSPRLIWLISDWDSKTKLILQLQEQIHRTQSLCLKCPFSEKFIITCYFIHR